MRTNVLGRTGLKVSHLGLGGLAFRKGVDASTALVRRATELGITYIDTAAGYGNSEECLGPALDALKPKIVLSTKLGAHGGDTAFAPQDKAALTRCVETSLRFLKRDRVDILMIHEPDRPAQYAWWTDPVNAVGPVMELLDELKKAGKIGFTGLGGTTAYEIAALMRTGKFDVVLTAFNYSLLWREAEHAVLPAAKAHNMGVIVGSPLQQGALARRYDNEVNNGAPWLSPPRRTQYQALYRYLDDIGLPLAEAGIRFVASNPEVHCVLMGAATTEEIEQNAAAIEKGPLPATVLKRLAEIAAMVPFRPYEEPFGLPFGGNRRGPGMAGR
jgi:aryl-alcohol dehydrogenase-like predicted oxidoreductase